MIVKSKNFELKLEEITQEKMIDVGKNETEQKVLTLIHLWKKGIPAFQFKTSGSTGTPKTITITREKIEYSTLATFERIDPDKEIKNVLLCLNPNFVGGAMVVFRALIMDLDLFILEPTANLAVELPPSGHFDMASMVPMQYELLKWEDLKRFGVILIGGAPYPGKPKTLHNKPKVFSTYGMTETVSHVALRKLNEPFFSTTGDTKVGLTSEHCLQFRGQITDHKWLKTNDLGNIISDDTFEWLGRKDFVINSGGIKINPEMVEKKLNDQIQTPFVISSKADDRLGEKLVLVIESTTKEVELDYSSLPRYEKPKEIIFREKLPRTASDKVDRKTLKKLLNQ